MWSLDYEMYKLWQKIRYAKKKVNIYMNHIRFNQVGAKFNLKILLNLL